MPRNGIVISSVTAEEIVVTFRVLLPAPISPATHRLALLAVVVLGAATSAFGVVVTAGWYLRWTAVLDLGPGPSPLAFNAGLGLALTGVALAGMSRGRYRPALVAAGYDLVVGPLTLVENLIDRNLGIDQLFAHAYLALPGAPPGRIAPNTAACLTAIGAGVMMSRPWRPRPRTRWLALSGAIVTGLAVAAAFGHAAGLPSVYGWGRLTGMSVAAAVAMALLGSASILLGWADARETPEGLQWWVLMVCLLSLVLDVLLWLALEVGSGRAETEPVRLVRAMVIFGLLLVLVLGSGVWAGHRAGIALRALQESEARYRGMVQTLGEGIAVQDADDRIVQCNAAAERILGLSRDERTGAMSFPPHWRAFYEDGSPLPEETHPSKVTLRTGLPCRGVVMRVRTDPDVDRWVLTSTQPLIHPGDVGPYGVVTSFTDITDVHRAKEQLEHRALHDDLTGLPNRALLLEHLSRALARSRRTGAAVGVLFLDLDGFKAINDSFGHSAGDEYLTRVATRIRASVRASDLAARVGGDEFVVVCENLAGPADAAVVADQIQRALATEIPLRAASVTAGASIGIAVSHPGSAPETLLRDADAAMYVAKHHGGRRWEPADASQHAAATRILTVEAELRRALERRELRVCYQPLIELQTGAIVAVEALLRWQHPERGLILPGEFIDVAEQRGLIGEIGTWVLHTACAQAADWHRRYGAAAPSLAVNVSSRQLDDHETSRRVSKALDTSPLPPDHLCLEVTESQLFTASTSSTDDLRVLSENGVRIAVDDFGTGYAGFDYLRRLPVSELKIDRSYVDGTGVDPTDTAVTAGIVALGLNLGLTVVAEGVETPRQLQTLRDMHCSWGQGWLWHRALPAQDIDRLLADHLSDCPSAQP
jgi:diguanylate cyclase (GGDEF)-like protein/PAS domain S-box-containing protein